MPAPLRCGALKPATPQEPHKAFKSYEPGFLHMDVKYLSHMQNKAKRRYLFVAIKANKSVASARAFLKALHKACLIRSNKLLTDNCKEFTDRLFASRERQPSGHHSLTSCARHLRVSG